jgi:integrase
LDNLHLDRGLDGCVSAEGEDEYDEGHRTWTTDSPVRWVKRRKVPKPSKSLRKVLTRNEVLPVLAAFAESSVESPWRRMAATCIYAGLRPGEAIGLHKEDLDTRSWTLAVRQETREVASEDRCPRCNMRLWVSPVPRKVRFYDLRHTHATLLRRAGVDLGFVQRALGHSSPEITAAIYDHSDIEDFREVVERALTFGSARVNAPVMQGPKHPKGEGPEPRKNRETPGPSNGRGDWI